MSQLALSFEAPLSLLSADEIYQAADHALLTMLREDRGVLKHEHRTDIERDPDACFRLAILQTNGKKERTQK